MRGARPERAIERAVDAGGVLERGESLVVACSGGPDSAALAGTLAALAPRLDLTLTMAFVHHGLRASAWQDECVALALSAALSIPLRIVALEPQAGDEARLRDARYRALSAVAKSNGAGAIVTAHHAEDQSETVLLALLRGTGAAGLRGMRARRPLADGVDLVRPLLRVAPEALRAYCHARALPYAVDPSNQRRELRRNAVREALAALRPLFPGLDAAVARAAEVVAGEQDGSQRAALRAGVRDELARDEGLRDIDFLHVEEAVRALERGGSGKFLMKPGLFLRIEGGVLRGTTRE